MGRAAEECKRATDWPHVLLVHDHELPCAESDMRVAALNLSSYGGPLVLWGGTIFGSPPCNTTNFPIYKECTRPSVGH